jgi:hypothetical protein
MVPQTGLDYKLEGDDNPTRTAKAGLPVIIEALRSLGVSDELARLDAFERASSARSQLYGEAIIAMLAAGCDHLTDIEMLRNDAGLARLLGGTAFPDARRLGEFLNRFHTAALCAGVQKGKAVIPDESVLLQALARANHRLIETIQRQSPSTTATLDWDTQVIASECQEALTAYEGTKGYQPAAIRWAEQGLIVTDQFRPGNVNSGFALVDLVKPTIDRLVEAGVTDVSFRGDSAAYDWNLIEYFVTRPAGPIRFAITADQCATLRNRARALAETAWRVVRIWRPDGLRPTEDRWAEVEFVSDEVVKRSRMTRPLRYIVVCHADERTYKGQDGAQPRLPGLGGFVGGKFHFIVTNSDQSGEEVIRWHRERCGSIERVFRVLSNDQAARMLPPSTYGGKAAWYRFNVILFNLVQALRLLTFPEELKHRELKGLRLKLIDVAGTVVRKARGFVVKILRTNPALSLIEHVRECLATIARAVRGVEPLANPAV